MEGGPEAWDEKGTEYGLQFYLNVLLYIYTHIYLFMLGKKNQEVCTETSLAVQQLRLRASTAGGVGSIPG